MRELFKALLLLCFFLGIFVAAAPFRADAIEISPSDKRVPAEFIHRPGKRYSIFAGNPARVQKVNEVQVKDFESKIELAQKELSLENLKKGDSSLNLSFEVTNKGKRSYVLSFPDSQRYDIMIQNAAKEVIYAWSDDKEFIKESGQSFLNRKEKIVFKPAPAIDLTPILDTLKPGVYQVTAFLSNYPEVVAQTELRIVP